MINNKMCRLERLFITMGFKLVHDGQRNPGRFKLPPEEIKFFTRKYQLYMDDKPQSTWAVFKYDERSKFVDFDLHFSEQGDKGARQQFRLNEESTKEVFDGETESVPTKQSQ